MINIKEFTANWKKSISDEVNGLEVRPSLAIIQVEGFSEASNRYVKNKLKDCEDVGINGNLYLISETSTTEDVIELIKFMSEDGIILQLPVPKHIDVKKVTEAIPYFKDVDGFKPGTLFDPCTPKGALTYLEANNIEFKGRNAVIIGRSEIVGKPMANMLIDKGCTVSVINSSTNEDTKRILLHNSDIVVSAAGHRGVMSSQDAPNAVIVDVGINFNELGKLCGDVITYDGDEDRVTPVPGGVGLLTRCQLLDNVMKAYRLKETTNGKKEKRNQS